MISFSYIEKCDNSNNSYTFQNLPADTFRVIISDNNGCTDTLGAESINLTSLIDNGQINLNNTGIYMDDMHSNSIPIGFPTIPKPVSVCHQ